MDLFSKTAKISQRATIIEPVRINDDVHISDKVSIGKYTVIGKRANIGPFSSIGNYCIIDHDCDIALASYPTNFLSMHTFQYNKHHFGQINSYSETQKISWNDSEETIIGHDVRIGPQVIISRGVTIGAGAAIAPGSFVCSDIPPYAIASGSPAKVTGFRFNDETISKLLKLRWWEFNPEDLGGIEFSEINNSIHDIDNLKLHFQLRNQSALKSILSNNVSLSKSGIIWFSTPYAHVNRNALDYVREIKILETSPILTENDNILSASNYTIISCSYDESRNWYRINFEFDGGIFSNTLKKSSLHFILM